LGTSWDEAIPSEIKTAADSLFSEFHHLNNIKIPRIVYKQKMMSLIMVFAVPQVQHLVLLFIAELNLVVVWSPQISLFLKRRWLPSQC